MFPTNQNLFVVFKNKDKFTTQPFIPIQDSCLILNFLSPYEDMLLDPNYPKNNLRTELHSDIRYIKVVAYLSRNQPDYYQNLAMLLKKCEDIAQEMDRHIIK
ncbi:hypothetical protein TTHERM_00361540 (macronuclear) [Tetrahymena thermophila SB210]|uniref:Uncharacterized protein n=1 Tax=Tetrahymena thermophila (strain SB210) TaxID=312017 RepID=Q22PJ0_TETTS|nr:hypothetical protein TTHERM_00361540 [Tetrahymena thermophila SB210]EAR87119.1 hypothetical protein TTHERM_00361540 [Tetrahymena thermophila SB210]|eukprot:XP_001007364.1 hypothetical protein TTHERM_00361540 [Tetrahymena thermophila SB210]